MLQIISILILLLCVYMELLGQNCPRNPENTIIFIDSCPTKEADYITDIGKGECEFIEHADHVIKTYKLAGGKKKIWLFTTSRKDRTINPYTKALREAIKCKIKIISTSTSSGYEKNGFIELENILINRFVDMGGRYYAAAGNYGKNLSIYPVYPAAYEGVTAIGAKMCNWENPENSFVAKYSNYGTKVKFWTCGDNPFDVNSKGTSFAVPRILANKEG